MSYVFEYLPAKPFTKYSFITSTSLIIYFTFLISAFAYLHSILYPLKLLEESTGLSISFVVYVFVSTLVLYIIYFVYIYILTFQKSMFWQTIAQYTYTASLFAIIITGLLLLLYLLNIIFQRLSITIFLAIPIVFTYLMYELGSKLTDNKFLQASILLPGLVAVLITGFLVFFDMGLFMRLVS